MAVQAAMDAQMSVSRLLLPLLLVQDPAVKCTGITASILARPSTLAPAGSSIEGRPICPTRSLIT